jgi:hypothetical protein
MGGVGALLPVFAAPENIAFYAASQFSGFSKSRYTSILSWQVRG